MTIFIESARCDRPTDKRIRTLNSTCYGCTFIVLFIMVHVMVHYRWGTDDTVSISRKLFPIQVEGSKPEAELTFNVNVV